MNDTSTYPRCRTLPRQAALAACLIIAFSLCSGHAAAETPPSARNAAWAVPVNVEHNLYRVAANLYRSERIEASMIPQLKALGIRTVVNLRTSEEDPSVVNNGLSSVHIPIQTWNISDAKVVDALRAIRANQKDGPVLVHCMHGADRTGLVIAMYRLLYQGWSRTQAKDELRNGGYGFHDMWINIPRYIDAVDLDGIRRAVASTTSGSGEASGDHQP